ncbi:phosphatase PAP2 family protein [Dyadobacter sp. CY323]|uniref:phosphatase PAP2 family protein n=1 Tax=Dyadobacter sp. CY323 TaxID=2907302 RepID=UPI001F4719D3|nr:phosphatase PAP2 family protein [Dyadobacter sp. CY323]MCE6987873.1 phosphatase PAP2 family protein [Dyadobacter sp. CY323]
MTETIDTLIHSDQELFLSLNGWHYPWLDTVMYWITYKYTWVPMYLVLIFLSIKPNAKKGLGILVTVIIAVVIADKITSGIMKPYFIRFRPCHEPDLKGMVHQVTGCGGLYGFASSHASTSFAVAMTWFALLRGQVRYIGILFFWAALYSYSRVYVGVHYPADIFVGALVGLLTGVICTQAYYFFLRRYSHN